MTSAWTRLDAGTLRPSTAAICRTCCHQRVELIGKQRLHAVGERAVRIVVHFDDQAVGSHGDGGAGKRRHLVALAGAVAGIDDDGQMAQALHGGHDAEIERVAGVIGEGAHAALAQDDVVVALAHDVLGGHQKFFQRGGDAALQQDGLAGASGALEQREILHVAGADLDDIGVLVDQVERFVIHRFGDDQQAEAVADFGHDLQPLFAEPLERIRRGARLEGAAAEELGSGAGHALGDGEGLLAALDGARAGDDGQARPPMVAP